MDTRVRPAGVAVLERMLHEGFATGGLEVVDEVCSPDMVEHQFGLSGSGAEAIRKVKHGITQVHTAFPDLRFEVAEQAERDGVAWVRAEGTATNTGPFVGPPTGLPVRFTVIDVARVVDGRIVEHWGVPDRFAILAQVGGLGARAR